MATQNRTDGPVAIGIDLGTSKCCVAAVRDGRAHVLENEFGQRTTPSWVAFNSQQRLVGGAALDQAVVNCANTVSAVKRTLGRTYDDVKGLPSTCKIKKCYTNSYFQYCVNYRKQQLQLSSEQITAMMLTKMTDVAKASLGCDVNWAVISVPACYGNAQRTAVMNAAKVAGLEVLQLINETTAAGIAFEDNRSIKTPVTIAVVDFGAGKLDISVMKVKEKSLRVVAALGSPYHGGCDIDKVLVNYCVEIIQQKYGAEVKINDKGLVKLRLACEKAKKTLSLLPEAQVSIESLFEDRDVQIQLHRHNISELIDDDIRSTIIDIFERIFKENSMEKQSIDKVVLVGGSTRVPAIKSFLEEYFGSHKLDQTVNQDEAVAQGAALRAAALSGAAAGIEVTDVSSFDVCFSGSSQNKNKFDKIINKFSPIFSSRSHKFNEARGTKIRFFERMFRFDGSKCDADLLSVEFTGSFVSSDRFVNAELILQLNKSGMFSVSIPSRDDKSRLNLMPFTSHYSYKINNWVKEEGKFRCDAKTEMERVDAEVELESLCYDVQSGLSELELMKDISHDELGTSKKAISNAMKWMTNNIESASLSEINQKINKVNNLKKDVHRMMKTARKKAIEKEEAAKKQVEIELLNKQIFAIESDLSGLISALEDSNFMRDFCAIINQCKAVVSSLITWKKDIESASLTEVSQKLEELTRVKREVDQLKADTVREKARLEEEKAEMELFNAQMSDFLSLFSEVKRMLDDTNVATHSDSRSLHSCASKLQSLVFWEENIQSASTAQVSQKLKELTELKDKVHKLKKNALEKARLDEGEEKAFKKQVDLFNALMSDVVSQFLEVKTVLQFLSLESCSDISTNFELCNARLRSFKAWKENIEKATPTEISKKLEELTRIKNLLNQLDACINAKLEEEVTKPALSQSHAEQPTYLHSSCNDSLPNVGTSRNVMNLIDEKRKISKSDRERSSNSYNSSGGSVDDSSLVTSASNHNHTERGRSPSSTRTAVEGKKHRSRNGFRSLSVDVANERESRLESGQSLERFQPSENLKNGQPSLSQSCLNSVDDPTKRRSIFLTRKVIVDQNREPRSSSRSRQLSGSEDIGHQSRTSFNNEEKVGKQRRSSRERSSSRSCQPSEHERVEHRFRTLHNSEEKEGEQKVSYRECLSSRSRHGSASSKKRRPVGFCSSLEDEHHHQPRASCEGTANEGPHLHQRGSSDRCTEQPTSARGTGSTLDLMKISAVGNHVTLPNKVSPWNDVAPSEEYNSTVTCPSKETRTASTTTSESTQTDVAILENNRGCENDTSLNDKLKGLPEEVKENILKFENLGILWPWLQIMENAISNMVNCEQCNKYRFNCCAHHLNNGFKEVSRVFNSVPEILSKNSSAKTGEINWNKPTTATLKPAENGISQRYTVNDDGSSNGNVDSVLRPIAAPYQSSTEVSDTRSSLGGSLSTRDGQVKVSTSCFPVYGRTASSSMMETHKHICAEVSSYQSHYSGEQNFYVPRITAQYEELSKK